MSAPCEHSVGDTVVGAGGTSTCGACEREALKVSEERKANLAIIEDTMKTWNDGETYFPIVDVILARIRARS